MISVRKADESQSIFLSGPHDKLAEAVDELIRLQEGLALIISGNLLFTRYDSQV